jgi:hypothetical protein
LILISEAHNIKTGEDARNQGDKVSLKLDARHLEVYAECDLTHGV